MHFLDLTRPSLAADLALEEALLRVMDDRPDSPGLLRVWEPNQQGVVLGASGRLADELDVDACNRDGVPITRRSSGGGTVMVGPGALNVSIFLRADHASALRTVDTAQPWVVGRIARAIIETGRGVSIKGLGDLTLGDRKVAGSAQRRLRRSVLVHATILNKFPLDLIPGYLRQPKRQPDYRLDRDHLDFVANLDLDRESLIDAIRREWGIDPGVTEPPIPWALADELERSTFGDRAWVERF